MRRREAGLAGNRNPGQPGGGRIAPGAAPAAITTELLFREAAGAVLGKMSLRDLGQFRPTIGQAAGGITDRVARVEGTVVGFLGKVGRDARDGIEGFSALVGGGDTLEE